jgi:hypothetical protein
MSYLVSWISDDDNQGTRSFNSEDEALDAARAIVGFAILHRLPSGSVQIFRDGQELEGEEAAEAFEKLGNSGQQS